MGWHKLILMLGTRKARGSGEEYRWAILTNISRFREDYQYCRMDDENNNAFIRECFRSSQVYKDSNAAMQGIRDAGIEPPYFLQIEHMPHKRFLRKRAAK